MFVDFQEDLSPMKNHMESQKINVLFLKWPKEDKMYCSEMKLLLKLDKFLCKESHFE